MLKRAALSTLVIAVAAIGSPARADSDSGVERRGAPVALHLNSGVEILGGAEAWSVSSRTHVGFSVPLGLGRVRPSLGIGATFALGTLQVADPRALSGQVSIGYYEAGPELRLGLRWVDGGIVDPQVFASFAYLKTDLDDRLMLDAVEGVEGDRGVRAALGVNWAQQQARAAANGGRRDGSDNDDDEDWDFLIILLPQQAELSWERSCGSERIGVTFSWGI